MCKGSFESFQFIVNSLDMCDPSDTKIFFTGDHVEKLVHKIYNTNIKNKSHYNIQ